MSAILFGSISTISDTSELQRQAFNDAFAAHGLDWHWGVDEYRALLTNNGGAARIADYAAERGVEVDAQAVHATKSALFQQAVAQQSPAPRPGVAETIAAARDAGWKVGVVTTTSPENLDALFEALAPTLKREDFGVVVDTTDVSETKPDPEAYDYALQVLDETPESCVAIEDNVGGLSAARAAGVACVAFPNANTAAHDFGGATTVDQLDFAQLRTVGASA